MASIVKPQVLVFQDFRLAPAELTEPLRAHISGGNAKLHRFDVDDEKALIDVGEYDRLADDTVHPWPDRTAGSLVDEAGIRLFMDDALLLYFEDLIGVTTSGRGTVTPVVGRKNRIRSSTLSFKANGANYPRSGLFNDRDVRVGDRVYVRGVVDDNDDCNEVELWSYVEGFAAETIAAQVMSAVEDANNQETTEAAVEVTKTAGPNNCVTVTADGAAYDGLADGLVTETYTIRVIRSSISGCNAARLRVTSASGTDDDDEVEPEDFGTPTAIGTRGLEVTFDTTTGDCEDSASSEGVAVDELTIGQTWEVVVTQDFEKVCAEAGDVYTGPYNDIYIVEVTKGGVWADLPAVTVTTVKGLDSSGPTEVTGANVDIAVGTYGLTIRFVDCYSSSAAAAEAADEPFGGDSTVAGLRDGDKFYITVVSGENGPLRTLILRHDLPTLLQDVTDLDLRLFITKTIEVTENRLSSPPEVNYEIEPTQLVVKGSITAYDSTWTDAGVEQPLTVYAGRAYIEYREWLTALVDTVNFIDDVADIDEIPGQLDERNPLKWGVYRALQNSNGTRVGYTAVADPTSLDSWQVVVDRVDGRDDVYNFVPLTFDREILNLFQAHVGAESSPEAGNWKAMFAALKRKTTKMFVGQSTADAQALSPTSTDGEVVLATLDDDPQATDTQYTRLSVSEGNAGFITYGIKAGDVVRFLFTIDAFGNASYSEFVVDNVLSENTLLLLEGHSDPISIAQKIEIWRNLSKTEIMEDLKEQAQSFADRRVVGFIPDVVGTAGNAQEGYFLGAALAGLVSGVLPHQGLTNVEIKGFDDLAAGTKNFFSESQIDELDDSGIWIATEDRDGTPHTRHALTTDVTDLNRREEMIRRNVDSMSYLFLRRLRPFIGRTNATPAMLQRLEYEVRQTIKFLKTNGFTAELGSQLIDGVIATGADGQPLIYIHPLAADRIVIVLNLTVPAPLNNIELHLVV